MKINQIVGEHKKGVKAKIYNKKGPEARKVPKRPPQQTPAGVATAFAETATLGDYIPGKSATIKDPEHGKEYTLDLTKPENMAALHPNDQGEIEFNPDFDAAGGGLGAQAQGQEQTPLQPGAPITIKTATQEEDMGGDPGDEFVDDVVDKDFERAQGRLEDAATENDLGTTPTRDFVKAAYSLAAEYGAEAPNPEELKKLMVLAPNGEVDNRKTFEKIMAEFQAQLPKIQQMIKELSDLIAQAEAQQSTELSRIQELAGMADEDVSAFGVTQHDNGDVSYNQGPMSLRKSKDGSTDTQYDVGDTNLRVQQNPAGVKTITAKGSMADAVTGVDASAQRLGVDPAKVRPYVAKEAKELEAMLRIAGLR